MAPGRVSIAIGAGNVKELLRPLGLDEGSSARRCRESVELMRGLLSGERLDYRGRHYQADGVELEFPVAARSRSTSPPAARACSRPPARPPTS